MFECLFFILFYLFFSFNFLRAVGGDRGGKGVEGREEASVGKKD